MWANCSNTNGSFVCACKSGFSGDGVTCIGKVHFGYIFIGFEFLTSFQLDDQKVYFRKRTVQFCRDDQNIDE